MNPESSIRSAPAASTWQFRGRVLTLDRPIVFGVLNVTPDSFSDGGRFDSKDAAMAQIERLVFERADGIDIGGESTRPQGAVALSAEEEHRRVVPIVREVRVRFPELLISVDTSKSAVADAALNAGADIINDVSALRLDPRLGEIVARRGAGLVLMHSRGGVDEMGTYQRAEYGNDVVDDVLRELDASVRVALAAGIPADHLVLDPGVGFAKRSEHSLRVLSDLHRLTALGFPVMVGVSRKRFIGELSGVQQPSDRVFGTVGANVVALLHGARLFRVHDVSQNRQALDVAWGIVRGGVALSGSQFPVSGSRSS
jgi:dihydropteroate synthase